MWQARSSSQPLGRQVRFVTGYFALYLGYLLVHAEGELLHWLTLVLVPLGGLALLGGDRSPGAVLQSIGLDRARVGHGMRWVIGLGTAFQLLQLLNAAQRTELVSVLQQPLGPLMPLGAFVLLLGTAATTEEVFFRGILQSRWADRLGSEPAALVLASCAFVLYHVPYAYTNPAWPSAGHLGQAVQAAAANGLVGGIALGLVFWRSGRNLLAAILLHALINLIPATLVVHRLLTRVT